MSDFEAVLLFLALLAFVIIGTVVIESVRSRIVKKFGPKEGEKIEGIGGWLLIPLFGLIATAYMSFADIYGVWENEGASGFIRTYTTVIGIVVGFAALYLLIPFFQKKKTVPLLLISFYFITLLIFIISTMIVLLTQPLTSDAGFRLFEEFVKKCMSSFIWIIYFMSSERVQNTFTEKTVEPDAVGNG